MEDKPCCANAAARKIMRLEMNGITVGLSHLDEAMAEVKAMGLEDDAEIGETLLKKIKIHNYVPTKASLDYKNALLGEYHKRFRS